MLIHVTRIMSDITNVWPLGVSNRLARRNFDFATFHVWEILLLKYKGRVNSDGEWRTGNGNKWSDLAHETTSEFLMERTKTTKNTVTDYKSSCRELDMMQTAALWYYSRQKLKTNLSPCTIWRQIGSEGVLDHNLGLHWMWVVSFTPRSLYPRCAH
jgi:hypothetical protein